jgi:hypothetical protein
LNEDRGDYWRLHAALFEEALLSRRRHQWRVQLPGIGKRPIFYLETSRSSYSTKMCIPIYSGLARSSRRSAEG